MQKRKPGMFRKKTQLETSSLQQVREITIDRINLYSEMQSLKQNREEAFEYYEHIIEQMEKIISQLEQQNYFLTEERLKLLSENMNLRKSLDHREEYLYLSDNKKQNREAVLFEIVPDEDSINYVFQRKSTQRNPVLEQSEFQLSINNIVIEQGHYFNGETVTEMSVQAEGLTSSEEQVTPCLINHHSSLVQCRSSNNQAPLRIFYLLFLQEPEFIKKLIDSLEIFEYDDSKILLSLFPSGNEMWIALLKDFLDKICKGSFDNQTELINYIQYNPLLDILLISLLKHTLPVENQDENLNLGDWKHEEIDHRALFRGLCNHFDLHFEEDKQRNVFKILPINDQSRVMTEPQPLEVSDQLLLSNKTQEASCENLEISLHPRPPNNSNVSHLRREEPIFKIWFDLNQNYYRIYLSIRPERFLREEANDECSSFKVTQKEENSDEEDEDSISDVIPRKILKELSCHSNIERRAKYDSSEVSYLQMKMDSKECSHNVSFLE